MTYLLVFVGFISVFSCEIFFQDNIENTWEQAWVHPSANSDLGKFTYFNGTEAYEYKNSGIQTSTDNKFYTMSKKFSKDVQLSADTFVLQYSVYNPQDLKCGGTYVKVFPAHLDLESINNDSEYSLMLGPDTCGHTQVIHVIFRYHGVNRELKKKVSHMDQSFAHMYTFVIHKDLKYTIYVDGEHKAGGDLWEDLELGDDAKYIKDPMAVKPADWVDEAYVVDKDAQKPGDWVDEEFVVDEAAAKPEDWDDQMDGDWERPTMKNPAYLGEWEPPRIPNIGFKGKWEAPFVENPGFSIDSESLDVVLGSLGIEIWQVQANSVFSNFLVTNSEEHALSAAKEMAKTFSEGNSKANSEQLKEDTEPVEESEEDEAPVDDPLGEDWESGPDEL